MPAGTGDAFMPSVFYGHLVAPSAFDFRDMLARVPPGYPPDIGVGDGPGVLKRQWALDTTQNIQNPPFSRRKNQNTSQVALVAWAEPGDRDGRFSGLEDPRRLYQLRMFKTSPAYALSKTIRGVTKDETGAILPFCKVIVQRTSDNIVVAQTVSDGSGNYSVTVPS